jgi:ribosomal protein L40E
VLCKCAADLPQGSQFCLKCGAPVTSSASSAERPVVDAVLACSKCGANLPDEAQFCFKCGKPVSSSPKSVAIKDRPAIGNTPPPETPRPRRKRWVVLWILLALLVGLILWATTSNGPSAQQVQEFLGLKHDQTILENPFSVSPHNFRYYKFSLPEGSVNVAIVGQFSASLESRNSASRRAEEKDKPPDSNIEVYVLSESAFAVWQNGYTTSSVYESGRVAQGTVQANLPAGAGIYYLVFSNKFDLRTAKAVHASVLLRYKSWLPEWLRRGKDSFWNWLGL